MQVLVDTSVWSLVLRRRSQDLNPTEERVTEELGELLHEGRCELVGVVRQELLSGIRSSEQFEELRHRLRAFPAERIATDDYEEAAALSNKCRAIGISGSLVDFLLCAISSRRGWALFTTDADFTSYAKVLPLKLHSLER